LTDIYDLSIRTPGGDAALVFSTTEVYVMRYIGIGLLFVVFCGGIKTDAQAQTCTLMVGAWEGTTTAFADGGSGTSRTASVTQFSATAVSRETKESFEGTYQTGSVYFPVYFEDVPEGVYDITVRKPGFQTTVQEHTVKCRCATDKKSFADILVSRGSPRSVIVRPEPARLGFGPSEIFGGVLNGKAISLPRPSYPRAARAVRAGGTVEIKVLIDEDGNVVSASAISGHELLLKASEAAARQAKFSTTCLNGRPVRVTGKITYTFTP
jgi:TonB family protein